MDNNTEVSYLLLSKQKEQSHNLQISTKILEQYFGPKIFDFEGLLPGEAEKKEQQVF